MKKCHSKKKPREGYSRRQFLSYLGVASAFYTVHNPLKTFFNGIADGLIASAQAQTAMQARNYVCVLYGGAPTRWVFDNFLTPNGPADGFIKNKSVNNWLTEDYYSADSTKATYKADRIDLSDGRVIYLPPVWNADIPVFGGGTMKMKDLLDNTMIIRGVNMQVDIGHRVGPARVPRPILSGPSISGMVADASSAPIQAVGTAYYGFNHCDPVNGRAYSSEKGTGVTLINGMSDAIGKVMSSFQNTDSQVLANLSKMNNLSPLIKAALDDLAVYAKSSKPGADVLFKTRDNAEALFKRSFGNLTAVYNGLVAKYADLERRVAQLTVPNILPATGIAPYNIASTGFSTLLPGQFAVAEFLLTNGLSSTITIGGDDARVAGLMSYNDEHSSTALNRQGSLICHTHQFRALTTMIAELKRALGPQLWEQTVVEVSAEFDRAPLDNGLGSDHAPEANTMTIMSGAIKKPVFIGNITVDGRGAGYTGTYGKSAPVRTDFASGIVVTNEHVASTVSTVVGTKSPVRAPSLVSIGSSGVKSLAEDPKNIG